MLSFSSRDHFPHIPLTFFSPSIRSTTNWRTGVTYQSIVSVQTQSRSSKTYSRGHIYTQHWSRWVNSWRTLSLTLSLALSLALLYTLLPSYTYYCSQILHHPPYTHPHISTTPFLLLADPSRRSNRPTVIQPIPPLSPPHSRLFHPLVPPLTLTLIYPQPTRPTVVIDRKDDMEEEMRLIEASEDRSGNLTAEEAEEVTHPRPFLYITPINTPYQ